MTHANGYLISDFEEFQGCGVGIEISVFFFILGSESSRFEVGSRS